MMSALFGAKTASTRAAEQLARRMRELKWNADRRLFNFIYIEDLTIQVF